jgi:P27 family predicted phage terminase small subunit
MGERGPKGKPTELRILHGDRDDRINRAEPKPDAGEVKPPYRLRRPAAAVWRRLAPDLIAKKVLTPWDIDQFAVYCDAVATYRECRDLLDEEGYTARGSAGGVVKNPHWQIMRDAASIMTSVGSRFGLTPADRSHIVAPEGNDNGGKKDANRLLG